MDVSLQTIAEKLREYDEYMIIYHIRPDGDCIGSAFALALALQAAGKKCSVKGQDDIPKAHHELTSQVQLDEVNDPVYIAVDSAAPKRVGMYGDRHFTFCIDHHNNTFHSADYRYVEKDCGACSEIIFKLIKLMGVDITKLMADFLYTALVTDTMCFRTSDTKVQSLETAAELARLGADVYHIAHKHMFLKSMGRIEIEKRLRDSFHFTFGNKVLSGMITLNDLSEAGIADSDLEGINSLVSEAEVVLAGVTIRELPDGTMRCSVRTSGDISADEICRIHGGGGHFHAACCELETDMLTAREIMEKTCREQLEKFGIQG